MIQALLNVIAPDDCLECGHEGSLWCEWCRLGHEPLPSRCYRCHAMTEDYATCKSCKSQTPIKRLYTVAEYNSAAKQVIKSLKFGCKRQAALPIARSIAEMLPVLDSRTVITNVPTAPVRVRQRGFDHTKLLAKEVARITDLPYRPLLAKVDNTRQVGAARSIRQKQVIGTFRLRTHASIKGPILLIDDVVTTGATLSECIRVLRDNEAKNISCAVFAYSK